MCFLDAELLGLGNQADHVVVVKVFAALGGQALLGTGADEHPPAALLLQQLLIDQLVHPLEDGGWVDLELLGELGG